LEDVVLIRRLQKRDEAAFETVFKTHYKGLHAYACSLLENSAVAEEVVQNIFYKLWERGETLSISGNIAAYLYSAVNNESLNQIKHLKVRAQHELFVKRQTREKTDTAAKHIQVKELEGKLRSALNDLPEQCRTIFQLSRFEELRYREIADTLGISIKTVENQMGKALKIMRIKLADFLILIWIVLTIKL
jgi:RNA polymerase sigma-70 factor (ECF subfamily)